MVHHDSVFTPENGEGPSEAGYPYSFAAVQMIPPQGDSSAFDVMYDGDMGRTRMVKRLDSIVVTPCGSFNGTWEYSADIPGWNDMETQILKPGIGFVYMQLDLTFPYHPPMTHRLWLTEYLINSR